jgi:SAM-dependent methyltransferase
MNLLIGKWCSAAVCVAAELRVADLLAGGEQHVDALAHATGSHGPSLYRLLRFLAALGVFTEVGPRVFAQTQVSMLLRSDSPDSLWNDAMMFAGDWHWRVWGALGHTVRTGETAVDHLFGEDLFSYFAHQNSEAGETFHRSLSSAPHQAVIDAYDFSDISLLVDIGGGEGTFLNALVRANPTMRGILFERPEVIQDVRARPEDFGLDDRIDLLGGDFFFEVPPADAYVLRNIIHDWSDEESAGILANCRLALRAGGRVLVIEQVMPEWNQWSSLKLGDLEMMLLTHGRERTEDEFRSLFAAGGLSLKRLIRTSSDLCILEGVPL